MVYIAIVFYRAHWSYTFLKLNKYGLSHNLFEIDGQLGYKLRPNSTGYQYFPLGGPYSVQIDKYGFRLGVRSLLSEQVQFVTLGDSHVFADGCSADSSFGQIASSILQQPISNAGVSGYGYPQIYLLLGELLQVHKPKAVVLFCSPWLGERATSWYAPTYNGTVPVPYVYDSPSGGLAIRRPLYEARLPNIDEGHLRSSEASVVEFLSFVSDTWWDLYVRVDMLNTIIKLKMILGIIPKPHHDQNEAERYLLSLIKQLLDENGVAVIAINMSHEKNYDVSGIMKIFGPDNLIDLDPILWNGLPEGASSEEYFKNYAFTMGNPPEVVDYHLNCDAHQFIGDTLANYLDYRYQLVDTVLGRRPSGI